MTASQPAVARDVAAFRAAAAGATDVKSLLSNPAFMKVFLTANGLSDQIAYPALAQKALISDPSDTSSLASKLSDTRWQALRQDVRFRQRRPGQLQKPGVLDTLASGYAEVTWRQSLDAATPGLVERAHVPVRGVVDHVGRSDPRRFRDAHGRDDGAQHTGGDRLPAARGPGEGDQLAARHHQVPGSEVRRDVHAAISRGAPIPARARRRTPIHRPRLRANCARSPSKPASRSRLKRSLSMTQPTPTFADPDALMGRVSEMIAAGRLGVARPLLAAVRAPRAAIAAPGRTLRLAADAGGPVRSRRPRCSTGRLPRRRTMPRCAGGARNCGSCATIWQGAASDAADAVVLAPGDPGAKALLGTALLGLGCAGDAAACLGEAVAVAPCHAGLPSRPRGRAGGAWARPTPPPRRWRTASRPARATSRSGPPRCCSACGGRISRARSRSPNARARTASPMPASMA